ncbi:hypothetical protein [Megasphaera elsdenii]|uniref:hypothetical protein n=1 Tax=Megasphaera elsdenii TaxID=907 RepID=UPI003D00D7BE
MDVNTFNLKMMTQLTAGFQETKNFNPRTREGCDCRIVGLTGTPSPFQSTHLL